MSKLRTERYSAIDQIPASNWDSLQEERDFFQSHSFIKTVEEAKVEGAWFCYLLFYENDKLVGNAVLSSFTISLDLFNSTTVVSRMADKWFPKLFKIKLLVGGLPASFGQHNLHILPEFYSEISAALAEEMRLQAQIQHIKFMAIKEFSSRQVSLLASLEQEGFFVANSIPYMSIPIRWATFNEYLKALRHTYRRQIRSSLKKMGPGMPEIFHQNSHDKPTCRPILVVGDASLCPPACFYELYLKVMKRTPNKLETLNKAFFDKFYHRHADEIELLVVQQDKHILSAAILIRQNNKLTFMLAGHHQPKDQYDSYFNLIYGILAYAIKNGVEKLNLGQTAYRLKQRIGGQAEDEYLFFGSTLPWLHSLLSGCRKLIFPTLQLQKLHVFRSSTDTHLPLQP